MLFRFLLFSNLFYFFTGICVCCFHWSTICSHCNAILECKETTPIDATLPSLCNITFLTISASIVWFLPNLWYVVIVLVDCCWVGSQTRMHNSYLGLIYVHAYILIHVYTDPCLRCWYETIWVYGYECWKFRVLIHEGFYNKKLCVFKLISIDL